MKKILASLTLILPLLVSTSSGPLAASDPVASPKSENEFSFLWAFATLRGDAEELESVDSGLLKLDAGDTSRMFVEPLGPCFIYVVLKESGGELHLLYSHPSSDGSGDAADPNGARSFIPAEGWFSVDDAAGEETIYLLGSTTRLTEFERLLNLYAAQDDHREELANAVVAHIVELRREHWNPQSVAEKPAMIAGKTRGGPNRSCVACLATEISASGFFTRTFLIEHFDRGVTRTQDP